MRLSASELSVIQLLGIIGTVAGATATGTWALAQTVQSNELAAYKAAKDLNLPEAIHTLSTLSKTATLSTTERKEYIFLQQKSQTLEIDNTRLKQNMTVLSGQLNELNKTLQSLTKTSKKMDIPLGEARYIVPNNLAVGVPSIYRNGDCVVRIGDDSKTINAGGNFDINFAGKIITLTLTKVYSDACSFNITERPAT